MRIPASALKVGSAAILAAGLFASGPVSAEAPGAFEDARWTRAPDGNGFDYAWTGKPGRYYFIEQSPDLSAGSWGLYPYATKGDGGAEGLWMEPPAERFFFRLRYTDSPDDPLLLEDFNASGFSNRVELDAGGNPFSLPDADGNGVPDPIDAFWADEVPAAWKQALPDDPDKAFYDPDNAIAAPADVKPGDDYDGDGRSNLREYLDGTDPADFFNGEDVELRIRYGDGQTGAAGAFLEHSLIVRVLDASGEPVTGAPVRFATGGGHDGLGVFRDPGRLENARLVRTGSVGAIMEYRLPPGEGPHTATASIPGGNDVTFTLHTVDAASAAKPPIRNFGSVENPDGSVTYTWTSQAEAGDWFQIERRQPDGSWAAVYETTYGSAELPYVPGETDYELTLPAAP